MRQPADPVARPDDHDDAPPSDSRFQRLSGEAVRTATRGLQSRIYQRFPQRSLWEVAGELVGLVEEVIEGAGISRRRVRSSQVLSRLGILLVVLLIGTALALSATSLWTHPGELGPMDWLPLIETVVNDLVFTGVAVFFLLAVPQRMERKRVLMLLHRLRSLAHVIDMHQLDKVPERLARRESRNDKEPLNREQMTHYLDYCTELLSLVGKAGALFGEDSTDGEVLDAVEGIETLTSDMARKVWQKVAILQAMPDQSSARS